MFNTFGATAINPSQVSYASIAMTADVALAWPAFQGSQLNVVALTMDLTANAGTYILSFPDARSAGKGTSALLRNTGAQTITVRGSDGSAITSVGAGVAKYIYLTDNSSAGGTWGVITFGTGTSAADASLLAGYGLQAISATLNASHPTVTTAGTITVAAPTDIAKVYVATGGSVAANFPTSNSAGSNFFTIIKNNGTGTVTLTPSGADTIDGAATIALAPGDAAMVCSLGISNGWVTIGLGRSVAFAFTQLVKNVAGGVDITLTAAEAANKVISFTGLLTGNINVIVPNTVGVYYLYNNTTGAFSLTVKTAAGTGIAVTQGTRDVGVCDATNVLRAVSNVAASTSFSAGSAGAPSINFVAMPTTGFYAPSANVVAAAANGLEVMSWNSVASAVNWWDVYNSATGNAIKMQANGTDPNIGIRFQPKGTGKFQITDGTDATKVAQIDASGISTGTTRTYTLPDLSDTLVLRTSSDTGANRLKNKDLESTTVQFVDSADVTKTAKANLTILATGQNASLALLEQLEIVRAMTASIGPM